MQRYAQVSGVAARAGVRASVQAGARAFGKKKTPSTRTDNAIFLREALGGLKGPLMKVAQLVAAIPDLLPPSYAAELATLQADAPPMNWSFVQRRMATELGADWQDHFQSFSHKAAAAASLGQVHRALGKDGMPLACKLQYPDMASAIEADLSQLKALFALFEAFGGPVRTEDAYKEIAARLREELDYEREAKNMILYRQMLTAIEDVHVPTPVAALSTKRLLTMTWMDGEPMAKAIARRSQAERNNIATTMFRLWYAPFYSYGVLHGDPHPGNYTVRADGGINLMDFGCIRVFRPQIVQAVVAVYHALRDEDRAGIDEAFRLWGFTDLTRETREALTTWARFVYAPLLRGGTYALGETNAVADGRRVAGAVYSSLRAKGATVRIPPEFVMIDRASVGLGALFLRLQAEVDWRQLFESLVEDFDVNTLTKRQNALHITP